MHPNDHAQHRRSEKSRGDQVAPEHASLYPGRQLGGDPDTDGKLQQRRQQRHPRGEPNDAQSFVISSARSGFRLTVS
jgi:hypothetical protein